MGKCVIHKRRFYTKENLFKESHFMRFWTKLVGIGKVIKMSFKTHLQKNIWKIFSIELKCRLCSRPYPCPDNHKYRKPPCISKYTKRISFNLREILRIVSTNVRIPIKYFYKYQNHDRFFIFPFINK